ncbi:GatB/YqeY domain-containing protein [bacterium AH-315-J21]|nr:GatB/YqeY domain-containing protein [bacterium AH-315-J21]
MTLMKKLDADLIVAMKARDSFTLTVLRGLKAEMKNLQIAGGTRDKELTDEQVITTLSSAAKRRRDSIEQFTAGDRKDLADKESAELEIIQRYLPEQMSEEKVREIVAATISELEIGSMKEVGKLMQSLMPKLKGKADGKVISAIAKEILTSQNSNS